MENDDMIRALSARATAASSVAEAVLSVLVAANPALREPLYARLMDANPGAKLSDAAAEWWAGVEVRRRDFIEQMFAGVDALLATDMPPGTPGEPPAST